MLWKCCTQYASKFGELSSGHRTGKGHLSFHSNPKEKQCQRMLKLPHNCIHLRSDQISCSVVSTSLWPHGLQHARPPCPSSTPRVYSDSCPFNQWCHPTISSSVVPFSSCLQSFPASGSFPMSQLFASGAWSIGASPLASVLPMNIQGWYPLGLTGLVFLQSNGLESSPAPQFESINSLAFSLHYGPTLTSLHDYWKNHSFDYTDLCWQSDVSAF